MRKLTLEMKETNKWNIINRERELKRILIISGMYYHLIDWAKSQLKYNSRIRRYIL